MYILTVLRLYRKGCIVLTTALVVCATASMILRFWLSKENKKAARADGDSPYGFRYVL
jgi:flagellar basal body-associated protein FliL